MVTFIRSDLDFILQQIQIAERNARGEALIDILPNVEVPWGLRSLSGAFNNLNNPTAGAADQPFPRLTEASYLPGYTPGVPFVMDSQPRVISNLIVDQTANNFAANAAANGTVFSPGPDGQFGTSDDVQVQSIPNVAPDAGLSAPFNSWMTFFGQFFDHGLDLVQKNETQVILIPLKPDDPLYVPGSATNFMPVLRTSTNALNTTSPFVDQNQTYSSNSSHQVFLRAYELKVVNQGQINEHTETFATGTLITNRGLGTDGKFGTGDDTDLGGMATWKIVKAQARDLLGINLTDADVGNVPMILTDAYGNYVRGAHGYPQVVMADGSIVEGDPTANGGLGISLVGAMRTGHAFLDDIAHSAKPKFDHDHNPFTPDVAATADTDSAVGLSNGGGSTTGFYDNELLDAHYIAGDGRVNENIGLTAVHHVFHSEHNRLVAHTKDVLIADANKILNAPGGTQALAVDFLNKWLLSPVAAVPASANDVVWNGERLFQAAKFGTEMQYQHLVFEEFARKIQPNVDGFLAPNGFDVTIDPSITAEFAHVVYRFGHSMLTETVDRFDPNFNTVGGDQMGLIAAFLNPLAFAASGPTAEAAAGAIVRGVTRDVGNAIDEFVTEALRSNLVGLPLDLAAINIARGRDTGIPSLNTARATFYEASGESLMKPYISWADFAGHLKHPESLVNFVAAYGTHSALTAPDVDTLVEKRAVALALVLGGTAVINAGTGQARVFTADNNDRLDFLNSTGAYASDTKLGGLNNVDFWVGGLAEKNMPFGGMLGSSFNFVFENQLEALQNGDRFYYLSRTAGMHFGTELENNSFAKVVMANTDATHLSNTIFSAPTWTLEVDKTKQYTGLGTTGRDDPTGGTTIHGIEVTKLVIRDDPNDATNTNYLQYTGEDHVVLGGTEQNDKIIAGDGDDTVYGDGGNDRLEGGYGNDHIIGGAGDDILSDAGGDNRIEGGAGNDVIVVGNMMAGGIGQLLFGGDGQDFIITTEDISTTFGGQGDDFILGAKTNLPPTGNEGDDWIEFGTQDGAPGDNFSPILADDVKGNDIFIGGGGFDEMIGEGGDDIFVGSDAQDKMDGMTGFDWITYKNDKYGVTADLMLPALAQPHGNTANANNGALPVGFSPDTLLDRFAEVEALSGSKFADILRGDNVDIAGILAHGGLADSAITAANIGLIQGLKEWLVGQNIPVPADFSFAGGNIIVGGAGSDMIEGRGGNDRIDGDRWLNVKIGVYATNDPNHTGQPIMTFNSMKDMIPKMLSGEINPGQLKAIRELVDDNNGYDTAVYSDALRSVHTFRGSTGDIDIEVDNYSITTVAGVTTVRHLVYDVRLDANDNPVINPDRLGADGEDTLTNVERLAFGDGSFVNLAGGNINATGRLAITDSTPGTGPTVGDTLTASLGTVTDGDGSIANKAFSYVWQQETVPGSGIFEDLVIGAAGDLGGQIAYGNALKLTADLAGLTLRVKGVFEDAHGVTEIVYSNPTTAIVDTGAVAVAPTPAPADISPGGNGIRLVQSDLRFILDQIKIAEAHAAGADLLSLVPNVRGAYGLRAVDGSHNNLVPQQSEFGASDNTFPRLVPANFQQAESGTSYNQTSGFVVDTQPRVISNLIVDQTANNQAVVDAAYKSLGADGQIGGTGVNADVLNDGVTIVKSPGLDGLFGTADDKDVFQFDNVAPDAGLSASFNSWMTFFGQFFDHGLDLVAKGGSGTVFMPINPDDPLYDKGADGIVSGDDGFGADGVRGTADDRPNFMTLTRATNLPGADGILGTADDIHEALNTTSPFVDQNQTYSSHPSHQVFLRGYEVRDGKTVNTGNLITNHTLTGDGHLQIVGGKVLGDKGGMATWAVIKAQARDLLGIELTDADVLNVPLLATDDYGNYIPGPNGFPQVVFPGNVLVEGNPTANGGRGISLSGSVKTGHAFLDDIAHNAAPKGNHDGLSSTPDVVLTADTDSVVNGDTNNDGQINNGEVAFTPGLDYNGDGDIKDIASTMSEADYARILGNNAQIDFDGDGSFNDTVVRNGIDEATLGRDLNGDGDTTDLLTNVVEKFYDDELLDAHYIAGDGRVNENIGLTAVHNIFHSEHNRLAAQVKTSVLLSNNLQFLNEWLDPTHQVTALPTTQTAIDNLAWNGQRIFQAAKFGTEMQYQHLVFEEFARTIQPNVDLFFAPTQVYDVDLDPSIVAEFAHTVYRFGHSMLNETVDRFDANFNLVNGSGQPNQQMGLIAAFLNPLAFAASGANAEEATGAIIRGATRQAGNEIDEWVTEALRNNLVGLPLDLGALNIARGRETGMPTLNEFRRSMYAQTGDSNMKAYDSWADFVQHIKHPASLINFIAAYGTHASITSATTLEAKRDAATKLVLGDGDDSDGVTINNVTYTDRFDFLNSKGAYAKATSGATTSGVDKIDFWIGGLAEKQTPFGGMLGSSFNFVFENQLEKLQDGDRFYYLERTAGLAFNAELESNSFAKLIMANSDATHLPALVFSTPTWTLEVDKSKQHTGLGSDGRADPTGGIQVNGVEIKSLVIRDNPATSGLDSNYLEYTGEDHVVLGGTNGNDILKAGEGDDTIWGDAGDDRMDGGYGNDQLRGGAGNDIITDLGGDDNIQGGDGHDTIHGGNGINLIIGGAGNDFIVTGEDGSESIGGQGNDFILGNKADEQNMGNEGHDWIEGGTSDGSPGDNFEPNALDTVIGNDVFVGRGENDKFNGEGGDDIMVGSTGFGDRYLGGSGFDWATFKDDKTGVHIDMTDRFFDQPRVPGSTQPLVQFDFMEGLSGSSHADVLKGDNFTTFNGNGAYGSVLTNFALIDGLAALFTGTGLIQTDGTGLRYFDGGNIILGGAGGDQIMGQGGSDFIDGDAWLNVRIGVDEDKDGVYEANEISFDSMVPMVQRMLRGDWNAGQLHIVREIKQSATTDFDTAGFSGNLADYTFAVNGVAKTAVEIAQLGTVGANDIVTVTDTRVGRNDGTDTLKHIERLQFADQSIVLRGLNNAAIGAPAISDLTPNVGDVLTVSSTSLFDLDNTATNSNILSPIAYFWQAETIPGSGVFEDIINLAAGEVQRLSGKTITVTADLADLVLRVRAVYKDQNGTIEQVYSNPTGPVDNAPPVGVAPVVLPAILEDAAVLTITIADLIGTAVDPEGVPLEVINLVLVDPTQGTLTAVGANWEFVPAPNFNGTVHFAFEVTDGRTPVTSSASLVVTSVNDLPTGAPTAVLAAGTEDIAYTVTAAELLQGFTDADNPILFVQNLQASNGTVTTNGTTFTITPNANFNGPMTLTYTVSDGIGGTLAGQTRTYNVAAVNDAPTGSPTAILAAGTEDTTYTVTEGQLLQGFTDVDGVLSVANLRVSNGTIQVSGGGTVFRITPTANFNGQVTITYDVTDGTATLTNRTQTYTLTSVNDGPTGAPIAALAAGVEDTAITFTAAELLQGFTDVDGDVLRVTGLTASNGTVTINGDGTSFTITPTANFNGPVTLTYTVSDGAGGTLAGQTRTYNVAAVNDTATQIILSTPTVAEFANTGRLVGTLSANDPDGGALTYTLLNNAGGRFQLVGNQIQVANGVALDFEQATSHTIRVRVADGVGPVFDQDITIGVTNVDPENVTGTAAGETIIGGAGADRIDGAGGNDIIAGRGGADRLDGGAGTDTAVFTSALAAANFVLGGGGTLLVTTAADGTDTLSNFETLRFNGQDYTLRQGTNAVNTLNGTAGADLFLGFNGNDVMNGNNGNDVFIGGLGNDAINGGANTDVAVFATAVTTATFALNANGSLAVTTAATGTDSLLAVETLRFNGADFNLVQGNNAANSLNGTAATDIMIGFNDNDIYTVGAGDRVVETATGGTDTVRSSTISLNLASFANIENLSLLGTANLNATGNGAANVIVGNAGINRITGGGGDDRMTGGGGNDVFAFAAGFGNDVITDFDANAIGGQDKIDVSALGITSANYGARISVIDIGSDLLLLFGGATPGWIQLNNVANASDITRDDFLFS